MVLILPPEFRGPEDEHIHARPTWRQPVGVLVMLGLIGLTAVLALLVAEPVSRLPVLVQALLYLVLGIAWVLPLKPLLIWMEKR